MNLAAAMFDGPRPRFFTCPADHAVLPIIAHAMRAYAEQKGGERLADARVFVPTRRAARSLERAFLDGLAPGQGLILPRIQALGDLDADGDPLLFGTEALAARPAVRPLTRRMILARLVRAKLEKEGAPTEPAQIFALAGSLGALFDSLALEEASPGDLAGLAPERFAEHARRTITFLRVVLESWPEWLAENGLSDPAQARSAATRALAAALKKQPPNAPVIVAGSTGAAPSTVALMDAVAHAPMGCVILPGLDLEAPDKVWRATQEGHPQHVMRMTLRALGADRGEVRPLPGAVSSSSARLRRAVLDTALRPQDATGAWLEAARTLDAAARADGWEDLRGPLAALRFLEAKDEAEEARFAALALRAALETPERTAMLVTPDRVMARRVSALLARWGLDVDDSAGRALAREAPGRLLMASARVARDPSDPIAIAGLLKQPLTALGFSSHERRLGVAALEATALRGLRASPDRGGYAARLAVSDHSDADLARAVLDALDQAMAPLVEVTRQPRVDLARLAEAHAASAEMLATSDNETGDQRLWRGDDGAAAAALLADLVEAGPHGDPIHGRAYAEAFAGFLAERAVRSPWTGHPRLRIFGPLEARLQHADCVVLAGLNEGVWPAALGADPWVNRAMRARLDLPAPERRLGLAAHDFMELAGASDTLLLRAAMVDGAPARPSRWLRRLVAVLDGAGLTDEPSAAFGARLEAALPGRSDDADIRALSVALMAAPANPPAARPSPSPPRERLPTRYAATALETLARDPYAIYAAQVLKLRARAPFDAPYGAAEIGVVVHRVLQEWGDVFRPEDTPRLRDAFELSAVADGAPPHVIASWRPRFSQMAAWLTETEAERQAQGQIAAREWKGEMEIGDVTLSARADRIDRGIDGRYRVYDYKTGAVPSMKQLQAGFALQLPATAWVLSEGGFPKLPPGDVACAVYLGLKDGKVLGLDEGVASTMLAEAKAGLTAAFAAFANGAPFTSRIAPLRRAFEGDYDLLARVADWADREAEAER